MANPAMKRSIKFDDESLGLYLDVQIPGQDWRRIRPDQARAAREADPSIRSGPPELSSNMIANAIAAGTPAAGLPAPRSPSSLSTPSGPSPLTGANATPIS